MRYHVAVLLCLPLAGAYADPPSDVCSVSQALGGDGANWTAGFGDVAWKSQSEKKASVAAALTGAQQDLQKKVCAGKSEVDCAILMKNTFKGLHTPYVDEEQHRTCAVVGIMNKDIVPSPTRALAEKEIDALGNQLAAKLKQSGTPTIYVEMVRSNSACAVPELDVARQRIIASLAAFPQAEGQLDTNLHVRLEATMAGDQISLLGQLWNKGSPLQTVGTVSFPAAAYNLQKLQPVCANPGVASTALPAVDVALDLQHIGSSICMGETFSVNLEASAAARVHVYTVAPDGSAYHVWPDTSGSGRMTGRISLGDFVAAPNPYPGDETLVAIAVPEASPLMALDQHKGFCRLKSKMSSAIYPANSSTSTLTWHINSSNCAGIPKGEDTSEQVKALFASAPLCP